MQPKDDQISSDRIKKFDISLLTKKYGTLVGLFLLCVVFAVLKPAFVNFSNILTILRQISMLSIMGAGLTVVMITKRIDLSIGYAASFLGVFCAALIVDFGVPMLPAVIITLVVAAIIGFLNGFAVAVVGIPDFIATLAIGFLVSGINQAYTGGHPISNLPKDFKIFGAQDFLGIPNPVIIMFAFLILVYILLTHTRFGRHTYAIGGNEEASLMSGVKIKFNQILGYVVCGLGVGITALVLTSRLGSAHPLAGDAYLMDTIACVYLGGTVFKEGEPNLAGTFVGALIMGVLTNGLTLLNVMYYYQAIIKGVVILAAVTITSLQRIKKK